MRAGVKTTTRITIMTRRHIPECARIVAASEPWKSLDEKVHFSRYIRLRQAHVCLSGKQVAGFVIFTPDPVFARGGYLRAIGVASSMRGRGIGKALMDFAEKKTAYKSGNLFLCVSSFNRGAQNFYRRLGYRKAGSLSGLIRPDASEYIYWKQLS